MPQVILIVFFTAYSMATVTIPRPDCPVQFEGRVEQMIEGIGPQSALATQGVVFKNILPLKGQVQDQIVLEVLKNGPIEITPGKEYRVQLRGKRICLIENI